MSVQISFGNYWGRYIFVCIQMLLLDFFFFEQCVIKNGHVEQHHYFR